MRPNSSLARNSALRLELFLRTTVMWQDETNERILNEGFVNAIIAVERGDERHQKCTIKDIRNLMRNQTEVG